MNKKDDNITLLTSGIKSYDWIQGYYNEYNNTCLNLADWDWIMIFSDQSFEFLNLFEFCLTRSLDK